MKKIGNLTRYCPTYIKGKAAKVVPGEYHFVITQNTLESYSKSVGDVYKLGHVRDDGPYTSSVCATRKIPGQFHEGFVYLWFHQPQGHFCDCILDVFPLGTTDQDEADKLGAEMLELLMSTHAAGLYKKYTA